MIELDPLLSVTELDPCFEDTVEYRPGILEGFCLEVTMCRCPQKCRTIEVTWPPSRTKFTQESNIKQPKVQVQFDATTSLLQQG